MEKNPKITLKRQFWIPRWQTKTNKETVSIDWYIRQEGRPSMEFTTETYFGSEDHDVTTSDASTEHGYSIGGRYLPSYVFATALIDSGDLPELGKERELDLDWLVKMVREGFIEPIEMSFTFEWVLPEIGPVSFPTEMRIEWESAEYATPDDAYAALRAALNEFLSRYGGSAHDIESDEISD